MSVATVRRTIYDDQVEAELECWPGIAWRREVRGKHYALVLEYDNVSRFVVYPCTPSDAARGCLNHLTDVKKACSALGATRVKAARAETKRPAKRRAPEAEIKLAPRDRVRLDSNPMERLASIRFEPIAVVAPLTVKHRLWTFWYFVGRIPAILWDLPLDWPKMPDKYPQTDRDKSRAEPK